MSIRATWKGVLKIRLVTIPIKVFPATEASQPIAFNQLHADCQTRLQQKKWCPTCAREVPSSEVMKGFEFEQGRYVLVLPEELDAVQPPSTKVIDLVQFADASELDPLYIDRSYYLAPDGPTAIEAFAVMRIALRHRVGIGKLAIYGREYLVAVRPTKLPQPVLLLHTLHHAAEVRSVDGIDELQIPMAVSTEQVRLAQQVIAAFMGPLDLADFTDQYQTDLRRLIDAKIAGEEIVESILIDTPPIVNLREALEQSLQAMSAIKKIPAKVTTPAKRQRA
jgi:DNA end-binding protein Ku